MALFDSLLSEVNERFQLGNKGDDLLSALFDLIINDANGLNGFIQMFHRAGLGDVADSWVLQGANSALSNQQTEDALGTNNLNDIAAKANLPTATTASALSYMIPNVVDELTANGVLPNHNGLMTMLGSYLNRGTTQATGVTNAASGMPDRADAAYANAVPTRSAPTSDDGGSALRWILPLVLLGLLTFVGYQFCSKPNQNVLTATPNTNVRANTNPAKINPRVSLRAENGKYIVTGTVSSAAEKNQIVEALSKEFGEANVDFSNLKVDPNAKPASWLAKFAELVPSLKGWTGGTLTFEGENRLLAAGSIPQTVIDKIKSLFTGWVFPAFFLGTGADAQKAANEQTAKALETAETPQQVVDALNIDIINFATGKSDIPPANEDNLRKAATVLKTAPAGTMIEVSGHTDNVGNAGSNQKLSEERANSVKNELVKLGVNAAALSAKGYGDTKPKADNTTEAGKFQNRRIEYTLTSTSGASTTLNSNTTVITTSNSNAAH